MWKEYEHEAAFRVLFCDGDYRLLLVLGVNSSNPKPLLEAFWGIFRLSTSDISHQFLQFCDGQDFERTFPSSINKSDLQVPKWYIYLAYVWLKEIICCVI